MDIPLIPEHERLIQNCIKSGRYHSAGEVVRDALRLLREREDLDRMRLTKVRDKIAAGLVHTTQSDPDAERSSSGSSHGYGNGVHHHPPAGAHAPGVDLRVQQIAIADPTAPLGPTGLPRRFRHTCDGNTTDAD